MLVKSKRCSSLGLRFFFELGSRDAVTKARAMIDAELGNRKIKASGYRLLGYNSPFVPRSKQTHELQALIK